MHRRRGKRTYTRTTSRITSGEELKWRNGWLTSEDQAVTRPTRPS